MGVEQSLSPRGPLQGTLTHAVNIRQGDINLTISNTQYLLPIHSHLFRGRETQGLRIRYELRHTNCLVQHYNRVIPQYTKFTSKSQCEGIPARNFILRLVIINTIITMIHLKAEGFNSVQQFVI